MSKVITRIRSAVKSSLGFHETDRDRLTKRLRDLGIPSLASEVGRRCPADRWADWTDDVTVGCEVDPAEWPAWTDEMAYAISTDPTDADRTPADEPTPAASREWYSDGEAQTIPDHADRDASEPLHVWLDRQADHFEHAYQFEVCRHAHEIAKRFRAMAEFARLRVIEDIEELVTERANGF